ncbi:ATP-binding cassette [Lithospermum erythrorhizon]|uniref:ATP-binding cassette n=1 Tax=Lithospermum erythrorhizon TaxID=34254 RepID=A0AAV3QS54_LITER
MDKGKQIEEKEESEEAIELILFQVSECYVYMIPPRKSAASYRLMGHKGTLILISKEDQETLVKRFSSQRSLLVGEGCLGIDVRYSLVRFEVEGPNPTARADEWNVNKWAWEGALKVISKGEECIIRLEDKTTGELYARAFLREGEPHPVEPVIDSSRYFVLRVEENIDGRERHAFIGLGFRERPQSYDFEAALHDHMKYVGHCQLCSNISSLLFPWPFTN